MSIPVWYEVVSRGEIITKINLIVRGKTYCKKRGTHSLAEWLKGGDMLRHLHSNIAELENQVTSRYLVEGYFKKGGKESSISCRASCYTQSALIHYSTPI